MGTAAPLLERYGIFHSRSVEEARAFLQSKAFHLEVGPRSAAHLDARINGAYLPGLWLGYMEYTAPVAIRATDRDDYWVQFPVRGHIEAVGASGSIQCDARQAAVLSPTHTDFFLVRSAADTGRIGLSITRSTLVGQLAALLGEAPAAALDLAPTIDLTTGYGRSLSRYVRAAVADLEQGDSVLRTPATMRVFEQFVVTALLMSHRHNYSRALQRLERPIATRDVRRAIDYMEAHVHEPLDIADLVRVTGVAGRTLYMHFKAFLDVSPMRYLHDARLRRAREALMRADPEASVTRIASDAGFTHAGRFSLAYRHRFGESPSETLKSRRRAGARPGVATPR